MAALSIRPIRFSGINETGLELIIPKKKFVLFKHHEKITPLELKNCLSSHLGFSEEHIRLHFSTYRYTSEETKTVTRDDIGDDGELAYSSAEQNPSGSPVETFIEFSLQKCKNREHCHP